MFLCLKKIKKKNKKKKEEKMSDFGGGGREKERKKETSSGQSFDGRTPGGFDGKSGIRKEAAITHEHDNLSVIVRRIISVLLLLFSRNSWKQCIRNNSNFKINK